MVRLKARVVEVDRPISEFQFQYGTIEGFAVVELVAVNIISIPVWYD